MSAADDVLEMKSLSAELADRLVGEGAAVKQRIGAVADAIGVTANRALEFLRGKARRVDAWEKEYAQRRVQELRELEQLDRENAHLAWLHAQIGRLRETGEEFHGPQVDGLEHLLRVAGGDHRPVAVREAAGTEI